MLHSLYAGLLAAILFGGGALAQGLHDPIETGVDLHAACAAGLAVADGEDESRTVRFQRQRCRNYLSGFVQASVVSRNDSGMTSPYSPSGEELFCYQLPGEMSWEQMEQLVVDYGEATPDALTMYASDFLVEVFMENYPCEEPDVEQR